MFDVNYFLFFVLVPIVALGSYAIGYRGGSKNTINQTLTIGEEE